MNTVTEKMNEQQQKKRDGETEQEYLMRMVFGESECRTDDQITREFKAERAKAA